MCFVSKISPETFDTGNEKLYLVKGGESDGLRDGAPNDGYPRDARILQYPQINQCNTPH